MGQGDKNAAQVQNDGADIDRIMKEIEDLERKIDTAPVEVPTQKGIDAQLDNIVALHPEPTAPPPTPNHRSSLVESDAVPSGREPLFREESAMSDETDLGFGDSGSLGLKIGGCTEVQLDFTRAGVSVNLHCTDEGLVISTDQGAEFRIPFRKAA